MTAVSSSPGRLLDAIRVEPWPLRGSKIPIAPRSLTRALRATIERILRAIAAKGMKAI
jgi:hypothetical protein